jgi:CMP-N,N'-diacetyllegionaminic acid synthase
MIYAFIPARGNSKRVPRKNAKLINGKPLIYWTIKAALESQVDKIYFSTEDAEMAVLANDIAFQLDRSGSRFDVLIRNPKLSQDHVQLDEVLLDAYRTFETTPSIQVPTDLMVLQPTSPLRNSDDINSALNQWYSNDRIGCLFSGYLLDGFVWKVNAMSVAEPLNHDPRFRLGKQWTNEWNIMENGAIYITNAQQFSLYKTFRYPPYQFFEMDKRKSVDIDTPNDFQRAAELLNYL